MRNRSLKEEGSAPRKPASPQSIRILDPYIKFLSTFDPTKTTSTALWADLQRNNLTMAAIFDPTNPASPLAYESTQTALILLDFQALIVHLCGDVGRAAVAKARVMRDWALEHGIMVVHSVIDSESEPLPQTKGVERIGKILHGLQSDPTSAQEPTEVAFSKNENEYIVLKPASCVSGLKSNGALDLLKEHGIRSLIVCGLSTSGAVLRTVIGGTDEGFVVTAIEDACADPQEGVHDMLVERVFPGRAHVAASEEFLEHWKAKG